MIFEEKFNDALLIFILRLCFLVEIAYKMSVEPEKSKVGEVRVRNVPWVEKYRPSEFNQIVGNQVKLYRI